MSTTSPGTRNRLGLWALTATHAANDFYTGAVAALLPFFVLHAEYSYAAVAGITLAATALSSVAQPMFGYLSDRYGMRWMSLAGLLAAGAGIALSGIVVDSYAAVWIVVAISGIGVAAYHPAATMEARELGGGTSGSMSLFSVGGNVGVALAPSAVILVVGTFGLSGSGFLMIPAVVLGLVHVLVSWKHLFSRTVATERAPAAAKASIPDDWRAFAWLTAVLATWSVAYVGTSTFISLYSIQRFDVTTGFASIALSVFPAAGAVGTLAGGWLADRFGRLRIVRTGYLLAAVSAIAIVLAPSPVIVIVAAAVLGTGLFLPFAAQITLSHSYLPNRIGMASGVTLGLTLSLGGLVSPLLGSIADHTSVQSVFVIVAVLLVAGFALSFILKERRSGPVQSFQQQNESSELESAND
ncbi:FSR family fosmidomycin resistance protein-like MFS transporter [Antricoccus suffuscus]|uniref:FSR family fosmidomycin resistance protein-like MFS transporter n=1 Tax=Antricoccus suffuscus TaxID=1629062 RepID=A0A2T0ZXB7_9ACTN|nr:MFS transporter [Antricoccus suffuscus]PRZ41001.1 FSR family fosmidomycin resistance protein-like MFS transporter [Antricoccus suffuscus]